MLPFDLDISSKAPDAVPLSDKWLIGELNLTDTSSDNELIADGDGAESEMERFSEGDREGGGGSGLPSSFPNSLNSLSNPGCICLAITGKLFKRSLNVWISFFFGCSAPSAVPAIEDSPCELGVSMGLGAWSLS